MNKFLSTVCASGMAAAMAITPLLPAQAAPVTVVPAAPAIPAQVELAKSQEVIIRRNNWRGNNGWRNGGNWRGNVVPGPGYGGRDLGSIPAYRGHRGFRDYRPGYRRHNGFWYPAAAFIAGAIVGGALNNGGTVYRGGNRHVSWCYDRYRSYRASDNTFQPYNGPRQQCYSPYS